MLSPPALTRSFAIGTHRIVVALVCACSVSSLGGLALAQPIDSSGAPSGPKRTKLRNPGSTAPSQPGTQEPAKEPKAVNPSVSPSSERPPALKPADAPGERTGSVAGSGGGGEGSWSVVIASFRGEGQREVAQTMLARVRTEGGLPDAEMRVRGEATVISLGTFASAEDAEAQAALRRVQSLEIGVERPYTQAFLAPPEHLSAPGSMPQFNLVRARELYGPKAIYSLQVGVYGRQDLDRPTDAELSETRKAAEIAAFRLRQEGELAFYYHGPRLSMVTIGVFDLSDFDPQLPAFKSPRLKDAQTRFPYNLYNGQAIREKRKSQNETKLQPSNLVALPKK